MNRVALVTGGTRGIGGAISIALKSAGYKVAANYASRDDVADAFAQATGVPVFKWNISDFVACEKGIADVARNLGGPVEVLVNNAGITRDSAMHKMDIKGWQEVMDTNLTSCFNMARCVIDSMRERKFGRIINISSLNGQLGQFGQTNYSAAKAGIFGFTKGAGARKRRPRHHRQQHRAGLYRHRDGQSSARGYLKADCSPDSRRPLGRAGRGSARGRVSGCR